MAPSTDPVLVGGNAQMAQANAHMAQANAQLGQTLTQVVAMLQAAQGSGAVQQTSPQVCSSFIVSDHVIYF